MAEFEATGVANQRERPRVLLWTNAGEKSIHILFLESRAGTLRAVSSLDQVDPREWDVLVTDQPYAKIGRGQFGEPKLTQWERVPSHLFIFALFDGEDWRRLFEFNVIPASEDGDRSRADLQRALVFKRDVPGHEMRAIRGLPEPIQDLVKDDLLPAIEHRTTQHGIEAKNSNLAPAVLKLRPFLFGPQDLIMAGSYETPEHRSVWLVPTDAGRLDAWFDAALAEWHQLAPNTFPNISTWQADPRWDTARERVAREHLLSVEDGYAKQTAVYLDEKHAAVAALGTAHEEASKGSKALLTSQDDELQAAALVALESLGFQVEDMDATWPSRERREDFRIRDELDPSWLVIADATGVAKGAPGSKITSVLGYVTKYVLEERPETAPGIWIIVNRLLGLDPKVRGPIYRPDDLRVLEENNGLALDSPALYLLSENIEPGSSRATQCRTWLRAARGQITIEDAEAWLLDV